MPKYFVRQRRPVWVCFVQEVEADSPDQAVEKFNDEFDPEHYVLEDPVSHLTNGPTKVFNAEDYQNPLDVAHGS